MANRRMFAKTVIDADAFIEMPLSAQALYFHLAMRADDDGFVNNPNRIRKDIGAAEDDMRLLIAKRYLIGFESGVLVIKHWRIHNYIQADRYTPTIYAEEKSRLVSQKESGYELCIHDVYKMDAQVSKELKQAKDSGSLSNTTTTTLFSQENAGAGAPTREEKEDREGVRPPSIIEVVEYMRDELGEDVSGVEANKFVSWNEKWGWDCLPNWRGAAALWCARIPERAGR